MRLPFRSFGFAGACMVVLAACEAPPVGPPLPPDDEAFCEEYCAGAPGCDRDCVHACVVNRTLCPAEWDAAYTCGEARCDPDSRLPVGSDGCEDAFQAAEGCSPHGSCAAEPGFDHCNGCCAAIELDGAPTWYALYHDCVCERCPTDCGYAFCGTDEGNDAACSECAAVYCDDDVSTRCAADASCKRYDICVSGCPIDASSHCNEHDGFDACATCCAGDFTDGAARYDEVLAECACDACAESCVDSVICQGFDIIKPVCQSCLDSTCGPVLDSTCGAEPECATFMACVGACPD